MAVWKIACVVCLLRRAYVVTVCRMCDVECWGSLLTYSMEQNPSWEANWSAASQEIPRILWNPKVHHRTHKRTPPVPILSYLHPVHTPTSQTSILIWGSLWKVNLNDLGGSSYYIFCTNFKIFMEELSKTKKIFWKKTGFWNKNLNLTLSNKLRK